MAASAIARPRSSMPVQLASRPRVSISSSLTPAGTEVECTDDSANDAVHGRMYGQAVQMAEHEPLEDAHADLDPRMPVARAIGVDEPLAGHASERARHAVGRIGPPVPDEGAVLDGARLYGNVAIDAHLEVRTETDRQLNDAAIIRRNPMLLHAGVDQECGARNSR